jgi:hypothetical protein
MFTTNQEDFYNAKSLHSPASAKTFKTFQSSGKVKLPKLTGKRGSLNLNWSLRGFEKAAPYTAMPKKSKVFVFSPVKEKKVNLKKIQLKDEIVKAINDEMRSIEKTLRIVPKKFDFKNPQLTREDQNSVKTNKFFNNPQSTGLRTVKKTINFEFDNEDLNIVESGELLSKIKSRVQECSNQCPIEKESWLTSNSKSMKKDYEFFKKNFFDRLSQVLVHYSISNKAPKLNQFIMKFLLDIQSESDVRDLSKKDVLFLEKFLIDRYFKVLKHKILNSLSAAGIFKNFLSSIAQNLNIINSNFSIGQINKLTYNFYNSLFRGTPNTDFFSGEFFNSKMLDRLFTPNLNEKILNETLTYFFFDISRFTSFLIIKLVSSRYQNAGYVFNDIEHIEQDVMFIISHILKMISNLKNKNLSSEKRILNLEQVTQSLNSLFYCWNNQMYYSITQYIKQREMREYMDRKRKSQFIKPRRNDEKLKKIYKRIMKNLLSDFKNDFFGDEPLRKLNKKNMKMNEENFDEFLKEMNSKMFVSESEEETSVFNFDNAAMELMQSPSSGKEPLKTYHVHHKRDSQHLTRFSFTDPKPNLNPFSKKALSKRLTSKQQEIKFYEYYFNEYAQFEGLPLNHFYDPLKQKFENRKYKSFTIKYFKLLLNSNKFKEKVVTYIRDNQLVLDMLGEYSKSLGDLFDSVPTILLDQQKPKSKFLWTSYEFYFAMYFFKDKFNL